MRLAHWRTQSLKHEPDIDWLVRSDVRRSVLSYQLDGTAQHAGWHGAFWCVLFLAAVMHVTPAVCTAEHTHTHPFNGPLSETTQVSRYQKGKTNLDFTEARDGEWPWHQLGHMQVCTSLQTDNHAIAPTLSFFTGRMPFLSPNQQRQSTQGGQWIEMWVSFLPVRPCCFIGLPSMIVSGRTVSVSAETSKPIDHICRYCNALSMHSPSPIS